MNQRLETTRRQTTLGNPVWVEGFGFWSSRAVRAEFRPAPANTGIVFVRCDLPSQPRIPARVEYRVDSPLRTTLREGMASVEMVEHLLAALSGLQIDNCEVWVDAPEMPGLDGSCKAIVKALVSTSRVTLNAWQPRLNITRLARAGNQDSWIEARPSPTPGFFVRGHIDYGPVGPIGRQTCELEITPQSFCQDLAPARTFILKEEGDMLRSQNLAMRVTTADLLVFNEHGPIDNQLRFPDECVRHKILDIVGDFSLAACDISGQLVAHCSGHRLNAELVRALLKEFEIEKYYQRSA